MEKKRVIIIGDHDNTKMFQILKESGIVYDSAHTLEEACEKVFNKVKSYNAIVLDINFPECEGKQATRSGEMFLRLLENNKYDIPVLINAFLLNPPKSKLVVDKMLPWELHKFRQFIEKL